MPLTATSWTGMLDPKQGLAYDPRPGDIPEGARHWVVYNSGDKRIRVIVTMLTEEAECAAD